MGIIPATFCEKQNKLVVTTGNTKYMLGITVGILVIVESFLITFCILSFSDDLKMYQSSKTSSLLIFIQIFESAAIQLLLSVMFYVFRYKNIEIFQRVITYGASIGSKQHNKRVFKRILMQCVLNFILTVLYIGNAAVIWLSNPYIEWSLYICNTVILLTFFLYGTIYLTCFTCLLIVIVEWLRILNEKLLNFKTTSELNRLLRIRNDLLNLCHGEITLVYSLPIILQSGFALTSISSFLFLTTVAYEWLNDKFVVILSLLTQISLHSLPPMVIYVKALLANDIDNEVNF